LEKSLEVSPVIASLKASWNTIEVSFVGEAIFERTPAVGALPEICTTSVDASEIFPAASTAYATNDPSDSPAASIDVAVPAATPGATFQKKSRRASIDASEVTV
jgi:hypothetical protein